MIVALDMQLAQGTATGIGEYARGLASALQAAGASVIELAEARLDPWRFDRRVVWDQILLPRRVRASGAQLLHCTAGTMPLLGSIPTIVTVHDVAWLKVQQHTRAYARYYFGAFSLARYRSARAIAVDSQFSRRELLDVSGISPEKAHVVYPGVADDFCRIVVSARRQRSIFVPGTLEARKNLETLVRALPALPQAELISAGPFTPYAKKCAALAQELGVTDRVRLLGYVSRERMLELYATCGAVAVPSHYEGFGYAAAQALCAGTPLVASNSSSLPEVVQEWAPLIDPGDVRGWQGALAAILDDPARAQARANSVRDAAIAAYAWSSSARAMIALYERALVDR
jgi:glycosyltransferase involved in cell wall biosynthesis